MLVEFALCSLVLASGATAPTQGDGTDTTLIRKELEAWYQENSSAYQRWDFDAIMALPTPDFHAIMPDGTTRDRAGMELYIRGFLNGVKQWNRLTFTLDSLRVSGGYYG